MNIAQIFNVSIEVWGALFCIIAGASNLLPGFSTRVDKRLTNLEFCNAFLLIFDALAYVLRGHDTIISYYGVRISNLMVFVLTWFMFLSFSNYLCCFLEANSRLRSTTFYFGHGIAIIGIFFDVLNVFTGWIYYFDEHNYYHRAGGIVVSYIMGIIGLLTLFAVILLGRKEMTKRRILTFLSYIILPIIATVIQTFVYGYSLMNISYTVSIFMIYFVTQVERGQHMVVIEREQSSSRIKAIRDYIQPDELYNSLTVISDMAEYHPSSTKANILKLRDYMQVNFDNVYLDHEIPIHDELDHVRDYVKLVQLHYDIPIRLDYDTNVAGVKVIPNSIQSLVKEAIEYGIGKCLNVCKIKISVREEMDSYVVIVSFIAELDKANNKEFIYKVTK